jgi:hypothetical protein
MMQTETAPGVTEASRPTADANALRRLVQHELRRCWRLAILEAVGGVVAVLLAYFLFAVILDGFLQLPVVGRLVLNVVFVAGTIGLVVRLVRRLRALRLGEDDVALAIERQQPGGLQNRLINTLQLARDAKAGASLTEAVLRENCTQLGRTDLPPATRARRAAVRGMIVASLVLLGVGLLVWQQAWFCQAAARIMLPLAHFEGNGDAEDAASPADPHSVTIPANLSLVRATFEYPAYCGRAPRTVEQAAGELEALQGSVARLTFVFDQVVEEAALLLDRVPTGPAPERLPLEKVGPNTFRATLMLENLASYRIGWRQGQANHEGPRYAIRLLVDQDPALELSGLDRQIEVQPEMVLALKVRASDDFGLRQVGLFHRAHGTARADEDWTPVVVWPANGKTDFRIDHALAVSTLRVSEGDRVELALRGVDTDPLKEGRWTTGPIHTLVVGGEGALLQTQYEQILKTEAGLKTMLAEQKAAAAETNVWLRKLDGDGELRWDDPKNIDALHAAARAQAARQLQLRQNGGKLAREMIVQAGDLRLGLGMLADTEMNRSHLALTAIPGRDGPEGKRAALAEGCRAQERTVRSLEEMLEAHAAFRTNWELANMTPFVHMLADRQKQLAALSTKEAAGKEGPLSASIQKRQQKIIEVVRLIRPAFEGLGTWLEGREPVLGHAFADGARILGPQGVQIPLQSAMDELGQGRWSEAVGRQTEAARQFAALHDKLNEARAEAARQLLAALREKARSDTEAQKAIEQLKLGTGESGVKDFANDIKIDDIVRTREVVQAPKKPGAGPDNKAPAPGDGFDDVDRSKLELLKDSGVRQDPNILALGNRPEASQRLPSAVDTERNKVKPFVQENLPDLIGKLLEEADEIDKNYQTLTLSTNQNNSDPGEIGKQGGRINSTGAVAATGNKKPPTTNHGGVARSGRSGARAYGSVLGDQAVSRRGRDKAQEGEQRVPDQAGTIKETKGDDPYTDTSTGVGGKKVESEETNFSVKDAGKFTPDMLDRLDKPQKKYSIVERQGDPLDPRLAALLRDTTSKQGQLIERLKAIRKELKTLYLPTDLVDEAIRDLGANLDRLKERPDPELFQLELETIDRLRGAVRVFRGAGSSLQPSLPRERVIRGRVLDEPGRQTLPGYEEAVKRYYERLANQ